MKLKSMYRITWNKDLDDDGPDLMQLTYFRARAATGKQLEERLVEGMTTIDLVAMLRAWKRRAGKVRCDLGPGAEDYLSTRGIPLRAVFDDRKVIATPAEWLVTLDDPDLVGQSEYRMLREHVVDLFEDTGPEVRTVLMASMDEVIGWAKAVKAKAKAWAPVMKEES